MNISAYAKSIVMVIAAGLTVLVASISDGKITPVEYINIAIAIVTAVGVYFFKNSETGIGSRTKAIIAVVGAALAAAATAISGATGWGDVTASTWIAVLIAILGVVITAIVPNTPIPVIQTISADPKTLALARQSVRLS